MGKLVTPDFEFSPHPLQAPLLPPPSPPHAAASCCHPDFKHDKNIAKQLVSGLLFVTLVVCVRAAGEEGWSG